MPLRRHAGLALAGLLVLLAGCKLFSAIGILAAPPQIQKAQFHLGKGRLAILIEAARPGEENPVFDEALYTKLIELFREYGINDQVVPYEQLVRLRTANSDFSRWSLQRIGRALGAQQLLYLRLESLRMRPAPDHPLLQPEVRIRIKVIGVDESADTARQWPGRDERNGRLVECSRQPSEASDDIVVDSETVKLAKDASYYVAAPFHDVDLEKKFPREH